MCPGGGLVSFSRISGVLIYNDHRSQCIMSTILLSFLLELQLSAGGGMEMNQELLVVIKDP